MSSTAARLLEANGERVKITFTLGYENDPVTGDTISGGSEQSVYAYGYPAGYKAHEVDGKDILATDTRLLLPPIKRAPVVGCVVNVAGQDMRVMDVRSVFKSGAVELYVCQLRSS